MHAGILFPSWEGSLIGVTHTPCSRHLCIASACTRLEKGLATRRPMTTLLFLSMIEY